MLLAQKYYLAKPDLLFWDGPLTSQQIATRSWNPIQMETKSPALILYEQ